MDQEKRQHVYIPDRVTKALAALDALSHPRIPAKEFNQFLTIEDVRWLNKMGITIGFRHEN
jgi:hypothetical protein